MKFTVILKGSHTVVPLQNSVLTSNYNSVFVKRVSVFWEYFNITKQTTLITVKTSDGESDVNIERGYHTFDNIKAVLERSGVMLAYFRETAKCQVETTKHDITIEKQLLNMLGFNRFPNTMILLKGRSLAGDSKVDFNNGLRFVNIHCNLASKSYNINHWGKPSDVITSVTVPTDRPLLGSVASYIDVESRTSVGKGTCSELIFHVSNQDGKPIDIGEVLIEMYLE
jgi:hypothetical protein